MPNIDQEPVNAQVLAAQIEPHAVASWPARETISLNDWLLRFTNGFTHRGNSIATLEFSGDDPDKAIEIAERAYRDRNLPAMFQIASAVAPTGFADILRARAYEIITPTFVRVASPSEVCRILPAPADIIISREPGPDFALLVREGSRSAADGDERLEILSRVKSRRICVTALGDGRAVACGTGTFSGDHVGINLMRTTPLYRRRGYAQRVLAAIARWAEQEGAARLYLGVEMANAPAVALYERAGFVAAYSYRYFRKIL